MAIVALEQVMYVVLAGGLLLARRLVGPVAYHAVVGLMVGSMAAVACWVLGVHPCVGAVSVVVGGAVILALRAAVLRWVVRLCER
jgi:hypothetical protein